jgi:hypothetical protein
MIQENTHQREDPGKKRPSRRCMARLLTAVTVVFGLGLVFWLLWNWAGAAFFTFPRLTYVQAVVAIMVSGVLFRIGIGAADRHLRHPHHRPAFSACRRPARCKPEAEGARDIS